MANETPLKFWQGTNFWIALVLAFGGLFIGFPENDARIIVSSIFGLIAAVGALREKLKGAGLVSWKEWIRSKNTWNYLSAVAIAIVPTIPADLFLRLRDLVDAALGANWQGVVTAVFSIATMIYYIFSNKR